LNPIAHMRLDINFPPVKFKALRYNKVAMEIPLAQAPWLKFHKVITVRMLLYRSECWTLKEVHIRRMGTAELCFLKDV